eukprot:m.83511 g.83511  ORF g.83511 m.83511 type:complete len:81 (+) comp8691_c2_seq1:1816-2058(+)
MYACIVYYDIVYRIVCIINYLFALLVFHGSFSIEAIFFTNQTNGTNLFGFIANWEMVFIIRINSRHKLNDNDTLFTFLIY